MSKNFQRFDLVKRRAAQFGLDICRCGEDFMIRHLGKRVQFLPLPLSLEKLCKIFSATDSHVLFGEMLEVDWFGDTQPVARPTVFVKQKQKGDVRASPSQPVVP